MEKEIACLITLDDLRSIDIDGLEPAIILPGRAFVHIRDAEKVLGRDGTERAVIYGPDMLTADAETSMGMTREAVLSLEMEGFTELIRTINRYGV
jgi:NifB/MoaA-like Fe-S oxidoreductase